MSTIKISEAGGVVGTWVALGAAPMVFSDTVDIDFVKAPYPATHYARAFTPNQSGTIRLIFHDDTFLNKVVVAGTEYRYLVKRFNVTGTSGVTTGEMKN